MAKRKRKYTGASYDVVKARIDAREAERAAAREERAAARAAARASAREPLTPAERHEQEKAERAKRGPSEYSFSQHRMTGSRGHGSDYTGSVREEVLVDYLLDEGFASDEKSAQAIAGAMSEEWVQSIVEQSNTLLTPEQRRADELKYGMKRTTYVPPATPARAKVKSSRMPL